MASIYYYEAINSEGQRLSGHVEAESSSAVSDQLYRSGNFAVEIRESSIVDGRRSNASYGFLQRPPTRQQVTTLIREVAMLVAAGLPLVEALSMVARDIRPKSNKTLTGRLRSALEDGKSFHEALAEHPACFDAFVVNMVRVGEASGRLASTLERIADARERDEKTTGQTLVGHALPDVSGSDCRYGGCNHAWLCGATFQGHDHQCSGRSAG